MTVSAARGGMVVAPHGDAAETGAMVLREGGNAAEAMLAMAATIAVVYPHMNGIGGDGFWLLSRPGDEPIGIQACGPAARAVTPDRKSVVSGKGVAVRVDLGGRRNIKKKKKTIQQQQHE